MIVMFVIPLRWMRFRRTASSIARLPRARDTPAELQLDARQHATPCTRTYRFGPCDARRQTAPTPGLWQAPFCPLRSARETKNSPSVVPDERARHVRATQHCRPNARHRLAPQHACECVLRDASSDRSCSRSSGRRESPSSVRQLGKSVRPARLPRPISSSMDPRLRLASLLRLARCVVRRQGLGQETGA